MGDPCVKRRWLIIADDLTGAADSASAFARRRLPAHVTWGEPRPESLADTVALAFDADTRQLPAAAGARRHHDILRRLFEPRMQVFKKIDSTLRGHPAEEIGAMLDNLSTWLPRLRAVFTPAFPAGGRVTRNGRIYVHGAALEHTEFWSNSRPQEHASLVSLLESAGLHARHVPLDLVRAGVASLRAAFDADSEHANQHGTTVCVCDAETDDDLERIAAAALDDAPTFFAGSAGLAQALAGIASRDAVPRLVPCAPGVDRRGALLVVGSQAGPSRAALAPLGELSALRRVSISALQLLDDAHAGGVLPLGDLARELDAGTDIAIDILPAATAASTSPRIVAALARHIAPLAAHASALMATGGDTATALLSRCDVYGIRLVDEIEPGSSLGLTLGAVTLPVVTKSGGFGDAGSLRRIAERLRFIRQTGTVA